MKYMTPDLVLRLQSDNAEEADAADAAWEQGCRRYNAHIDRIRPKLPESARSLLDHYCLHDARVLALARSKLRFSMLFRLDAPAGEGLLLSYQLVAPPHTVEYPKLAAWGAPWEWVQYDEIELLRRKNTQAYRHSILFTGGREVCILFRTLRLTRFQSIVAPPLANGREGEELLAIANSRR
jgi:hypothetical protein